MVKICKISFLIHPTCWSMAAGNKQATIAMADPVRFQATLEQEKCVIERQKAYIRQMQDHELLIIYPIGESPEMLALEECGRKHLGKRCIILPNSLDSFISEFSEPELARITVDLFETCDKFRYTLNSAAIKVLYYNRFFSHFIQQEITARWLDLDQSVLSAEAFGEGFEQCAMTWKGMIATDLNWSCVIENNYDLSVSGAPFLLDAELIERIALQDDIRAFFWRIPNGRYIALLARCGFRFSDSQRFARLRPAGCLSEIYLLNGICQYPNASAKLEGIQTVGETLSIAVYEGGRKFTSDQAFYLFSEPGISYECFQNQICSAEIVS